MKIKKVVLFLSLVVLMALFIFLFQKDIENFLFSHPQPAVTIAPVTTPGIISIQTPSLRLAFIHVSFTTSPNNPVKRSLIAELLITDSQGRRTDFDPILQMKYDEIPNSVYYEESIGDAVSGEPGVPVKHISMGEPQNATYTLQVIGIELGSYNLEFNTSDINGSSTISFESGITQKDFISRYSINYSSQPGQPTVIEHIVTIQDIIAEIEIGRKLNLIKNNNIKNGLVQKLKDIEQAVNQNNKETIKNLLNIFMDALRAQAEKHIDSGFATQLQKHAQFIIELI